MNRFTKILIEVISKAERGRMQKVGWLCLGTSNVPVMLIGTTSVGTA